MREASICKKHCENLLKLIHSGLPVPNQLPQTMKELLVKINGTWWTNNHEAWISQILFFFNHLVPSLFEKREICRNCFKNIALQQSMCPCIHHDRNTVFLVYDIDLITTLHFQISRLWPDIMDYKQSIQSNASNGSNDIPFNKNYRTMLHRIGSNRNFISLILHIDGISLCKSTKTTLWLLSAIIIEVPSDLRYRRKNMILLSIYVGKEEPTVKKWLDSCFESLQKLKRQGKIISISNMIWIHSCFAYYEMKSFSHTLLLLFLSV